MRVNWRGVIPAITTPFREDMSVDTELMARHARWQVEAGSVGIVPFGSLGEGATVSFDEKMAAIERLVEELDGLAPVIPAVSALSTTDAVEFTRAAERAGASGFMVLPPYVYSSDWREMRSHVTAVLEATQLPCMLYNNPLAYVTDFEPQQIAELHERYPHMNAVKESSADVRRVTWIRALLGDSVDILVGVDDVIVEAAAAGARGWIAGLVNAFPEESVRLFDLAVAGRADDAFELYRWFLPLLRLDVGTKFVQKIKLAQEIMGWGSERVRGPRLILTGEEREETVQTVERALAQRRNPGVAA
ncbi:MAG TPA: dihydrodipicolinate synthase family protein [Trueperaceae bacterium]|nr:dihydrodipicolinate synthase family protein [Trueperaceae bacterium]